MLVPTTPVDSVEDYAAAGGGTGLRKALSRPAGEVREEVTRSGLRGRGGAGFPTGVKWTSVVEGAESTDSPVYLVCNAAEGEPGTYKDRVLLGRNPYQVLEGMLIGMHATGAEAAYIGLKDKFIEAERVVAARDELVETGWHRADRIRVVLGPDEYLYGEESALLEVIEHKLPMPRILPPYMQGLHATMQHPNPTVVNNVETFAHVTHILSGGAERFREQGTTESPGTMVFTLIGDVANPGVYELPLGTPLRTLVEDIGGATDIKAIYSGTSNTVITPDLLDLPMDFDSFREAGTGLGSGGFVVYGRHRDIVQVCAMLARFLAVESCGQCPACKLGTGEIYERLDRIVRGDGTAGDIDQIRKRCVTVTDGNRCYLPVGAQLLVASTVDAFADEFAAHIGVASDPSVAVDVPKIVAIDDAIGEVTLDADYIRKRSDWSYAPADEIADLSDQADLLTRNER